jgi:hypothetical protein
MKTIFGAASALALAAGLASAQTTFSIDYTGPTISFPDVATGTPITEADILIGPKVMPVLGPFLTPPAILINGGPLGGLGLALYPPCVGHPPAMPCGIEVDALSYGRDGPAFPGMPPGSWWFSVDEWAAGLAGPPAPPPCVVTEGVAGAMEASADVFVEVVPLPPAPVPPFVVPNPANRVAIDGNGFRGMFPPSPFAGPGIGLLEWNLLGPFPPLGDDVDALDVDLPPALPLTVYFSLDSGFPDPLTGMPNTASAVAHGFVGGDVLVVNPAAGALPVMYAPAWVLGLDRIGPPDSDDLDALILLENGIPGYQPPTGPYSWIGGQTDMLLFSVRRGSAVIGAPDTFFGAPIDAGDILMPALPGGPPFPGIFIAAENYGLATIRSGAMFGDDVDGLDVTETPVFDYDGNGIEDAVDMFLNPGLDTNFTNILDSWDIVAGLSYDGNFNGIPDESEFSAVTTYCMTKVNSLGCSPMIDGIGTPSVTSPKPFWVSAVDIVSFKNGTLFYGFAPKASPFYGGIKCVASPVRRTGVQNSGGVWPPNTCSGVFQYDMNPRIQSGYDPLLVAGTTVYAQYWSRDAGSSFNTGLTDGVQFTIAP